MYAVSDHRAANRPRAAYQPPANVVSEPIRPIFHQPWWLDIATDRSWNEAVVHENGTVIARWPYPIQRRFGLAVSRLPTLIRTLGPLIAPLAGKPPAALRRRLHITGELIEQLPRFAFFEQVFDPSIDDALGFVHRGFVVGAGYCFRIGAGTRIDTVWNGMLDKTRNAIRNAQARVRVEAMPDPEEFCRFHDQGLNGTVNMHGPARMRALLAACLERDAGIIVAARDPAGLPRAAVTFVWDDATMYYLLAARDPQAGVNGLVSLLVWHGMQMASERGLAFDLDGATTPGLLHFLSAFGAAPVQRLRVRRVSRLYRVLDGASRSIGSNRSF